VEAVNGILRELIAYQPPPHPPEVPSNEPLLPATAEELADTLAFSIRFNASGKARRTGWEPAAQIAAGELVRGGKRLRADAPSPIARSLRRLRVQGRAMIDPALTWTVAHLATDEALRLPCSCRVRTLPRRQLVSLVALGERLHLIGLRRELWCEECGEPPMVGWLMR
jgi:hypothetical protein